MAGWGHRAQPEAYQNFLHSGDPRLGPVRNVPIEEPFRVWNDYGQGWHGWTDRTRRLNNFRSKKYWARPVDGCRRGTLGRLKDGLTGQGADVFIVSAGDNRTLMREMPTRSHWSNWNTALAGRRRYDPNYEGNEDDMDFFDPRNSTAPWVNRQVGTVYDFRTRKYKRLTAERAPDMWSDAYWNQNKRRKMDAPRCIRDADGFWQPTQVRPGAGAWPGGRHYRY